MSKKSQSQKTQTKTASKVNQYEQQANATIEALRAKQDKSIGEKVLLFLNDVTAKIFVPYPCMIYFPVSILGGTLSLILHADGLIVGTFAGMLLVALADIVYYSIQNNKKAA